MTVQTLLLGSHLPERFPSARNQEHRVVAEAGLAAPLRHDLPSALALEELGWMARIGQREHADKACVPRPRLALEPFQQLCRALLLRRSQPRRADARKSRQRLNLDPRVIA